MQITDIATVRVNAERGRTWLFVEVSTDTGEIGIGEPNASWVSNLELVAKTIGAASMDHCHNFRNRFG